MDEITSMLDSLAAHAALIDADGTIFATNEAWRRFGAQNSSPSEEGAGAGVNYLDICQQAGEIAVMEGIREVLKGERDCFQLEYPCDSPLEKRWFLMTVSPLKGPPHGPRRGAVIEHANITQSKQLGRTVSGNDLAACFVEPLTDNARAQSVERDRVGGEE